ncbi:META domain-containing protein [Desulfovibrio sp. JC022]|uniref:META domain-containing protein n=1 Tax=Desulfovibrio sp. JC022 TaxID=2593642 RepID=UPI0013D0A0DC|nr:META domain-containing protein [Desulfovibrio sp. JC022]NDV23071.1 META domain-containing protein [Desulfovibrio sp. JC022]
MKMTKLKKHTLLALAVFAVLFAAGCAPKQTYYPAYENPTDTKWIAEDIDGKSIGGFAHIWMRLDSNGKIYGSGGCNSFRGDYSYVNGIFRTGPLAMTRKTCSKNMNLQEFKFMQALDRVNSMQERDGMLYMEGEDNSLLFYKGH